MNTVTLSPKFQVVIPKAIREMLRLKPGQKIQAIVYQNMIQLVPVKSAKDMRGFIKGIDTEIEREGDRV